MKNKIVSLAVCALLLNSMAAQRSKVQAAYRGITDYEETLKDGKPVISYLNKAKEAIDEAALNEDTKKQAKTHAYKLRIYYALFQYNLSQELKKLEATNQDKNERANLAYGNIALNDFEIAAEEINMIRDLDPKYLDNIQDGIAKGAATLDEEELKFAVATQQMKVEVGNIASGKYRAKKYDEAADYFYKSGLINSVLNKTKDTANFYNACVAAAKARNTDKILDYNKKMIEAKVAAPYNYESIYGVQLLKGDSAAAAETLKKGRAAFPNDVGLLTQETNLFLAKGRQEEALANMKVSVAKDPSNALYYFIMGNIYDNLANPKDKTTGKELEKPANFDELFRSAESNYLKSIELKPANKEHLYNAYYNLGAMYNNYGGYTANKKAAKITDMVKQQKENEAMAQEYFKKAIPNLEQALSIKTDDRPTMTALRKLYMITGDQARAKEMDSRLKGN